MCVSSRAYSEEFTDTDAQGFPDFMWLLCGKCLLAYVIALAIKIIILGKYNAIVLNMHRRELSVETHVTQIVPNSFCMI
jgi:hypothetical protein